MPSLVLEYCQQIAVHKVPKQRWMPAIKKETLPLSHDFDAILPQNCIDKNIKGLFQFHRNVEFCRIFVFINCDYYKIWPTWPGIGTLFYSIN